MDRNHGVIGFLLGVCVALGVALVLQSGQALPQAHAQASAGGGEMFAVTGTGTSGQSRDILFLVDPRTTRLMVYEYKDGTLQVGAVRNLEYDLRFEEFSYPPGREQKPGVKEMREASEGGKDDKSKRRR